MYAGCFCTNDLQLCHVSPEHHGQLPPVPGLGLPVQKLLLFCLGRGACNIYSMSVSPKPVIEVTDGEILVITITS